MTDKPFLDRFRQLTSFDHSHDENEPELYYSLDKKLSVTPEGEIAWSALSRKYPTNTYTKGRMRKGGWTRGKKPKYRSAKYISGKTDRRAGK